MNVPPNFPPNFSDDDQGGPGKKRRWPKRLGFTLAVFALVAGTGFAYVTWRAQKIAAELSSGSKGVVVQQAQKELGRSDQDPLADAGRIRNSRVFLLIGSDRRWGEKERGRSDTIMLVRLDPEANDASILSIPRDTLVDIPGYGQDKINHSYALGGPALLVKTVRQWLGVPIDHFAEVSFQGFSTTVNDIGGAYLPVDGRYFHKKDGSAESNWAEIDILPGYQKLSGSNALSWVRFRHNDTDTLRAARQQIFIRELGRQLRSQQSDYTRLPSLLQSFAKASASDIDNINELFSLANTARELPTDKIERMTMPVSDTMINGIYYATVDEASKERILQTWSGGQKQKSSSEEAPGNETTALSGPSLTSQTKPVMKKTDALDQRIRPYGDKLALCLPHKLPATFEWGDDYPFRFYRLKKYPAASAWATKGSGQSINWMWTTWPTPPILERPTDTKQRDGRQYQLFEDSGRLRIIAWQREGTWTWINNTLDNSLSKKEMYALARSCKDIAPPPPKWPLLPLLPQNKSDQAALSR